MHYASRQSNRPTTHNLKKLSKKDNPVAGGIIVLLVIVVLIGSFFFLRKGSKSDVEIKKGSVYTTQKDSIGVGEKLNVPIMIDTNGQTINAAEVYLNYDPKVVKVEDVTKDGSFFRIWIDKQPAYDNKKGELSLAGGLPNPGFSGKGQAGTVVLTLLQKQDTKLEFTTKTRILLNDGKATYVPLTLEPIEIKAK